jgi:hypothetical protein
MLLLAVIIVALGVLAVETALALRASGHLTRPLPVTVAVAAALSAGLALLLVA